MRDGDDVFAVLGSPHVSRGRKCSMKNVGYIMIPHVSAYVWTMTNDYHVLVTVTRDLELLRRGVNLSNLDHGRLNP